MEELSLLLVIGVLVVIGGSWLSARIGVAAPILLVLIGIGCSYLPGIPEIEIDPELILAVVLPPILYAAAVNVPVTEFRRNLRSITGLSVFLVVLSAVSVGYLLTLLLPSLPLAAAIALGAVVSPPDAVAATAIGKKLGLPPRLVTVLEGEGLVNDATALVLLRSAIAAVGGTVSFAGVIGDFAYAVAVAIVVGLLVGLTTVWARARIDQPTLTTAISFVVPFLAFIPAEGLHASGVLSVVVAGLVTGYKSSRHLSAHDRISERMNWRTIQMLLENGVFLIMGLQLSGIVADVESHHLSVAGAVGIGLILVVALTVVRVLFVIPLVAGLRREQRKAAGRIEWADSVLATFDSNPRVEKASERRKQSVLRRLTTKKADLESLTREGLGWRGGAVIAWSGMRGVVTLAAAQSLPYDTPLRAQLILIAFTVAVVTLLGMGSTLPLVIKVLKVPGPDEEARMQELTGLAEEIIDAGMERLRSPELLSADGQRFDPKLIDDMVERRRQMVTIFVESLSSAPSPQIQERTQLFRIMLEAEQAALLDARASGQYTAAVLEGAQRVIDIEVARTAPDGLGH